MTTRVTRRQALRSLGALALLSAPGRALPDHASEPAAPIRGDFCGAGTNASPLFIPGESGLYGRLFPANARLTLRADVTSAVGAPMRWGFVVNHAGRNYINPTLVLRPGQALQVELENSTSESTIIHWHGLGVDTRNDGAGMPLVPPGARYAYNFEVRDRAGLYWYHPHPHGLTAGQVYRGMFGLIEVEDDEERALRTALGLVPGRSEIPLMLQDRRGVADYAATASDRMHGYFGNSVEINGTTCPYFDVSTRIYRFRVLNASNARTYRLGLRTAVGRPMPFVLIGTDAGLLAKPIPCNEVFISPAERIDILVDLSDAGVGDTVTLETLAFDAMHMEMPAVASTGEAPTSASTAMNHDPAMTTPMPTPMVDHAAMGHGGGFAEGSVQGLLQLRVRERIAYNAKLPTRLSSLPAIDTSAATERVLRLGFAKDRWRINDRVFAMGEAPIEVGRDTVETWLIRNYFKSMPHAMHLHGFHFQVLERQTSPDQVAALKVDDRGRLATDLGEKDTVLVWPGESVKVAINFVMPFAGPQTYMFHCHNLEHEDGGMMLGVKVN